MLEDPVLVRCEFVGCEPVFDSRGVLARVRHEAQQVLDEPVTMLLRSIRMNRIRLDRLPPGPRSTAKGR